jgi:tRNA-specific 2-thiouridylase
VAAALLVEKGYDVVGLMLRLWAEPGGKANRCCTPGAIADARRVADTLGIPFYVRDYKSSFKSTVVDFFVEGYAQGITPNPCIVCNRDIRFDRLLKEALSLGGDYLATGHYARVRQTAEGNYRLLKGIDPAKDQSYMLYTMTQKRLERVLLPVGEYSKENIRAFAKDRALPVFDRPDSQDLCFLGAGDYRTFLVRHAPRVVKAGPIVNLQGDNLGEHQGLAFYTIGQRRGLGVSAPQPLYVVNKDIDSNTLVVGTRDELGQAQLTANEVNFVSGLIPDDPIQVEAKIRYKARAAPAILTALDQNRARILFAEPLRDITPGQAVVFYRGDETVGGGIIEASDAE